jgi:hypothetical protein
MTIDQIKSANRKAGCFFFSPDTMRFFRSRVGSTVYQGPGGVYFVTSEQFVPSRGRPAPRLYTVRVFDPATGEVDTAGEFNSLTKGRAQRAARKLADEIPSAV